MSTLSATNPTLLDLAKATDPNGEIAQVVEILNQTNEILMDATFLTGNESDGHTATVRTGLPPVTWAKFNQGVTPGKSTTAQIKFSSGMMEARSEIDARLALKSGNAAAYRFQQEAAQREAINQELASALFYSNEGTQPEAITGLAPQYNDLSAENADNIIDAGGTGTDNASIWLTYWSPTTIFGFVPQNAPAGLQVKDLGEQTIFNSDGTRLQALSTLYQMHAGLVVADWRAGVRICNIDKSNLTSDASSGADLADLMFQALELIPSAVRVGRPAFYMSRNTLTFLRRQTAAKIKQSTLGVSNVGGVVVYDFQGIPLRRCDALAADESRVV